MSESIGLLICTAFIIVLSFGFGCGAGYRAGMITVASGDYKCELIEQYDKTTEWECNKAGVVK
jgi:hypothetical protein